MEKCRLGAYPDQSSGRSNIWKVTQMEKKAETFQQKAGEEVQKHLMPLESPKLSSILKRMDTWKINYKDMAQVGGEAITWKILQVKLWSSDFTLKLIRSFKQGEMW